MSDFLQQLRNNSDKQRFKKKRHSYEKNSNLVYDRRETAGTRRNANRQSSQPDHMPAMTLEVISTIRDLLEGMVEKQERMIAAEERKAEAIERISQSFAKMTETGSGRILNYEGHDLDALRLAKKRARIEADPNRKKIMTLINEMRKENATFQEIADRLEKEKLKTFSGRGRWHAQTIHRLCQDA